MQQPKKLPLLRSLLVLLLLLIDGQRGYLGVYGGLGETFDQQSESEMHGGEPTGVYLEAMSGASQ